MIIKRDYHQRILTKFELVIAVSFVMNGRDNSTAVAAIGAVKRVVVEIVADSLRNDSRFKRSNPEIGMP